MRPEQETDGASRDGVTAAARSEGFGGAALLELIFLGFLVISQVYYGFRYILKYNSAGTSPTYSNTPFMFEAAKYGLALALFVLSCAIAAAYRGRTRRASADSIFLLLWTGGFVSYCLALGITFLQGTGTHEGLYRVFRGLFFFPLLVLIPFHFHGWTSLRKYFRIVVIFGCAYHVCYSAIQILAFLLFDRLPALAYPGGLVRFGGGWDDPNGFGGFLVLPILFVISDAFLSKNRRLLIGAALVALLALTVSLAALAALIGAVLTYVALRRKWWWLIGCMLAVGMVFLSPTVRELVVFAYRAKEASIEVHLTNMSLGSFLSQSDLIQLLFGHHGRGAIVTESYYTALAADFGCVGALWFLAIVGLTLVNAILKARLRESEGDHRGAETFRVLASFIAGLSAASVGIAYYLVFPVNLYLWLAIFAVWLTRGDSSALDVVPEEPRLQSAGRPEGDASGYGEGCATAR